MADDDTPKIKVPAWVKLQEPTRFTLLVSESGKDVKLKVVLSVKVMAIGAIMLLVAPLFLLVELKEKIAGPVGCGVFALIGLALIIGELYWYLQNRSKGRSFIRKGQVVEVQDYHGDVEQFQLSTLQCCIGYNAEEFDGDRWMYHGKSGASVRPALCGFVVHKDSRYVLHAEQSGAPGVFTLAACLSLLSD